MMKGRLMTLSEARVAVRLLNMAPMVCLQTCPACGEKQDALRCKQHAEPTGIRWKCGFCGTLNSWKNKACQVRRKEIIHREVA